MRKIILAGYLLISSFVLTAQDNAFPGNFIGHWKGKLSWMRPGKPTQEFTMQLKIMAVKDSSNQYQWRMSYGDSSKDERPYILKAVNIKNNHWQIDEQNGIVLDNYVAGNCLQGSFMVMGNTIIDNYCIENGRMSVEFFSFKTSDKTVTGKGTSESPAVESYRMGGYQYGMLEKVK